MNGSEKTVLVIDDNTGVQKLVERILQRASFKVVLAGSAAEASEVAARERPDVCLTDLQLPDSDGFALVELLREQARTENYKCDFIMTTGDDSSETIARAKEMGIKEFLVKPVAPEKLIETVSQF